MIGDKTGNAKRRPPLCAVTRAMADAGHAKNLKPPAAQMILPPHYRQ